ncbi:amidohydrolase family protein [Sorangium sp. So ce134]
MSRRLGLAGPLLLGASLLLAASAASATTARTILHNGKIFTSDPENLWAEAVAVRGRRVLAVGTDEEVLGLAAPRTRIIDLGGRTVIPGLNDAHVHVLAPSGHPLNSPASFVPGPGPTLAEVLDLAASGASATPAGTWLIGFTPEILRDVEPLASLLGEGVPLALGTDGIGAVMNPFVDLLLATVHPTRPEEALTMEEAVMAYTSGSACAELEEHHKGTLEPGRLADLAVLSRDIFGPISPEEMVGTTSELTMVGGEIVWASGALDPDHESR